MVTIPEGEPKEFTQGETIQWTRQDLSDFPADIWTLTYNLNGPTNKDITATADGLTFLATISKTDSATYTAGDYWIQGFVSDGSERYKVYDSKITVKKDLATITDDTYDGRSHNKIVLDALKALQEGRATHEDTQVSISTEHGSKAISYLTPQELEAAIDSYQAKYNKELHGQGSRVIHNF